MMMNRGEGEVGSRKGCQRWVKSSSTDRQRNSYRIFRFFYKNFVLILRPDVL